MSNPIRTKALLAALAGAACRDLGEADTALSLEADPAAFALTCPIPVNPDTVTMVPSRAAANQDFSRTSPMRIEIVIPPGVSIPARPYRWGSATPPLDAMIEVEMPNSRDEDPGDRAVPDFDMPQFAFRDADGYWQGVFFDEGQCAGAQPLELRLPYADQVTGEVNADIIGLYRQPGVPLDADDVIDEGDVIHLLYAGHVPARTTNWTSDIEVYPNVRYHDGTDRHEWDRSAMSPLIIEPGPTRFVHLVAPLDMGDGDAPTVQVIATDEWGNPSDIRPFVGWTVGTVDTPGGASVAWCTPVPDAFLDQGGSLVPWRATCSGAAIAGTSQVKFVAHDPGGAPPVDDLEIVSHWTRVHATPTFARRAVGDTHVHTGLSLDTVGPMTFLGSYKGIGDHHRQTADHRAALTYLDEVSGYDFGVLANHAVEYDTFTLAPTVAALPEWAPGGACFQAPFARLTPEIGDWWTTVQVASRDYQTNLGSSFAVFPGFEWHSEHNVTNPNAADRSTLHRVVLYRDFDANDALPLLPGTTPDLPPQCVVNFVDTVLGPGGEAEGNDAIVIPHMMGYPNNWDAGLTYGDTWTQIATEEQINNRHRIGEVFSARSARRPINLFEGDDSADVAYDTYQSAWLECGARVGLIGSSDNHSQFPGADNDLNYDSSAPAEAFVRGHDHNEPTGTAFVVTSDGTRGAIFEGMTARRTYASTGLRVWMDFRLTDGAGVVRADMGESGIADLGIPVSCTGASRFEVEVMSAMDVASVQIVWNESEPDPTGDCNGPDYSERPGTNHPWSVSPVGPPLPAGTEIASHVQTVSGMTVGGAALRPGQAYVVYARAGFFDENGGPIAESAWASPIWIRCL